MIKALFLDLDDTIFPTSSINPLEVKPFFDSLEEYNNVLSGEEMEKAKAELWERPFFVVAEKYRFSSEMVENSLRVLNGLNFSFSIETYEDYPSLQKIKLDKFLITTGFTRFQMAKIEALKIKNDFLEVLVDDPSLQSGGKVRVFESLLRKYELHPQEVLVIGDNQDSEIKAGISLGIPFLFINRKGGEGKVDRQISSFEEVLSYIETTNLPA